MKTRFFMMGILAAMLVFGLAFTGCNSDDDSGGNGGDDSREPLPAVVRYKRFKRKNLYWAG